MNAIEKAWNFLRPTVAMVKAVGDTTIGAKYVVSPSMNGKPATSVYNSTENLLNLAMKGNETVSSCMTFRSNAVAEAPLCAMTKASNDDDPVPDHEHPLSKLFATPNPVFSQAEVWQYLMYQLDSSPNGAYLLLPRGRGGVPVEVWNVPSDEMRPIKDNQKFVRGFEKKTNGYWEMVPQEVDVLWFRYIDPTDLWGSFPPLLKAARSIGTDTEKERFLKYLFENMGAVSGFFSSPNDLDDSAFDRTQAIVEALFNGVTNAGKTGFFDNGMTYQKIGLGLSEVNFGELEHIVVTKICGAFSVNPYSINAYVGVTNSSGLGGDKVKEAKSQTYHDAVIPAWKMIASKVGASVAPYFQLDPALVGFDYRDVEALQEDDAVDYDKANKATMATEDERRAIIGLEPLPNGKGAFCLAVEQAISMGFIPYTDPEREKLAEEKLRRQQQMLELMDSRSGADNGDTNNGGDTNQSQGAAGARRNNEPPSNPNEGQ